MLVTQILDIISKLKELMSEPNIWCRNSNKSCSIEELDEIITATTNGYYALPSDPYNEVYEGIFISDG